MNKRFMRFPGGKAKAVTLSYDDSIEEDQELIHKLEKYNMKATFNLIPGWFVKEGKTYPAGEIYRLVTEAQAKKMYDHPQVEIANHGNEHKYMTSLTTAEMAEDTLLCRRALERLFDRNVRGMAYPYGWYNEELENVLELCGITYCRTVESTGEFELPDNWLAWHPTCHHDDEKLMEFTEDFIRMRDIEFPMLFYVWGHTFEFETNGNWDRMDAFMKRISGREDIWYATNGEIYDYVKAYERLEVSIDGRRLYNPSRMPLWVEVDGKCYKVAEELVIG